jgi:hypothetical protein
MLQKEQQGRQAGVPKKSSVINVIHFQKWCSLFSKACHYVALFQEFVDIFFAMTVSIRWRLLFPTLFWSINTKSMVHSHGIPYWFVKKLTWLKTYPSFFTIRCVWIRVFKKHDYIQKKDLKKPLQLLTILLDLWEANSRRSSEMARSWRGLCLAVYSGSLNQPIITKIVKIALQSFIIYGIYLILDSCRRFGNIAVFCNNPVGAF